VIGYPIKHSKSPLFQQAALDHSGRTEKYVKIEVPEDQFSDVIDKMKRMPFLGWNITIPHKRSMAETVDEKMESALLLGGVNTVLNQNGVLKGYNTDGTGWKHAVRESFSLDIHDLRILILGAGGAGAGLARQAAADQCERLVIANRTVETAQSLAEELKESMKSQRLQGAQALVKAIPLDPEAIRAEIDTIDLIVNTTSIGLQPEDGPMIPESIIQPHLCVYDTIYGEHETPLIRSARQAGARTASGLSMLLHQGALSYEIWTGQPAPIEVMRQALTS